MPKNCYVIPVIKNRKGEYVESGLYTSLLRELELDRLYVNKIYDYIHSDVFINSYGDWINNPESLENSLDENGEPKIYFHRSKIYFEEFSDEHKSKGKEHPLGEGFYFTPTREYYEYDDSYGEIEYPVFLKNIQNTSKDNIEVTVSNTSDIYQVYNMTGEASVLYEQKEGIKGKDLSSLDRETRKDFNKKKEVLLKNFPDTRIVEDDKMPQIGVLGASKDGSPLIKVNPLLMTKDTLGHEYGHLLIDALGGMSNSLVKRGYEQIRDSEIADRVRKAYPDLVELNDDRIQKEILAQAIGEDTVKLFEEEDKRATWERWLVRLFRKLKRLLGIDRDAVRTLASTVVNPNRQFTDLGDTLSDYEQEQRTGFRSNLEDINKDIIGTRDEIINTLKTRHKILSKLGKVERARRIQFQIDEIEASNPMVGVYNFIKHANVYINEVYTDFIERKKNEELNGTTTLEIKDISRLKSIVDSYNILTAIRNTLDSRLTEANKEFPKIKGIMKGLNSTIKKLNEIDSFYRTRGEDIIVNSFAPEVLVKIAATLRNDLIEDYKTLPKEDRSKYESKDTYVDYKMEAYSDEEMLEQAKVLIKAELAKVNGDIATVVAHADTILDTSDTIIGVVVKKVAEAAIKARKDTIGFRTRLIPILRELEEQHKDKTGLLDNPEKLYDFMLEKDGDNKYTGRYITEVHNEFWDRFNEERERVSKLNLSSAGMRWNLWRWKEENAPKDRKAEKIDLKEYLEQLVEEGDLTVNDVDAYWSNDALHPNNRLELDNVLGSTEKADSILKWKSENDWKYRVPVVQPWAGTQWSELSKIISDKDDPRTKFYNLIVETNRELDLLVPYKFRIFNRLPGIKKDDIEKLKGSKSATEAFKFLTDRAFNVQEDDISRGTGSITYGGKIKKFIPIYFSNAVEISDQSLDLASIYFMRYRALSDYKYKNEILPEIELAKFFVESRKVIKTKSLKSSISKILNKGVADNDDEIMESAGASSNRAKQLNEWMSAIIYGERKNEPDSAFQKRAVRILDKINSFTGFNLLGINFIQGTANAVLAEALQVGEVVAKEHYNAKDYHKATKFYAKNLGGILKDVGSRNPTNVVSVLLEEFDILNDYSGSKFRQNTKFRRLFNSSTLFVTSYAGEHMVQSRVLLARLNALEAKNSKGETIGKMLDMYSVDKNGKLLLDKNVDLEKSNWSENDQEKFELKTKRLLSHLHGEYSDLGRVAIQRYALGRMVYLFRKFMFTGARRRWGKHQYNAISEDFIEGNYITTLKFLKSLATEWEAYKLAVFGENWNNLSDKEKANIRRTASEVAFLLAAMSMIWFVLPDSGDDEESRSMDFLAYQTYRLKAELLFFVSPKDAIHLLRSPAASMTVFENITKLFGQVLVPPFEGFDRYENGSWKGQLKIEKSMINMVPVVRQIYRFKYLDDQVSWFSK